MAGDPVTRADQTRAVAYLRVSTEEQAREGVSLAAQRAKVEAYAALYDARLVAVCEDAGASASTLERPALRRALAMLRRGEADALIVAKLDRLTRSVRDLGELVDGVFKKKALLSVAEQVDTRSAAGRMVLNIIASISQWEREAIGERTADAMRHMRERGEYTGGAAPLGFCRATAGGLTAVLLDPREQETIAEIRDLRARGMTVRAIAAQLAADGRDLRGEVTPGKVQRVLARGGAA